MQNLLLALQNVKNIMMKIRTLLKYIGISDRQFFRDTLYIYNFTIC